eukprot:TRINITY_DN2021_c0_g1_i4.p1 TRINITY_DN2021_c0_g1~~TRINITY_DN2021_c0_g1_i4.p1  ORF type:complete len:434 (+),score=74.81 TRINITY_DN2021_c0_g1_i4:204-1505(+)
MEAIKHAGTAPLLLALLCVCLLSCRAHAAVIYVSPDGSDAGAGTSSDPLASIEAAARRAERGDRVRLMRGDYDVTEECTFSGVELSGSGPDTVSIALRRPAGRLLFDQGGKLAYVSLSSENHGGLQFFGEGSVYSVNVTGAAGDCIYVALPPSGGGFNATVLNATNCYNGIFAEVVDDDQRWARGPALGATPSTLLLHNVQLSIMGKSAIEVHDIPRVRISDIESLYVQDFLVARISRTYSELPTGVLANASVNTTLGGIRLTGRAQKWTMSKVLLSTIEGWRDPGTTTPLLIAENAALQCTRVSIVRPISRGPCVALNSANFTAADSVIGGTKANHAISVSGLSVVVLSGCAIEHNEVEMGGCVVYCFDAAPSVYITDSLLAHNTAEYHTLFTCLKPQPAWQCTIDVWNTKLEDNTAEFGDPTDSMCDVTYH